MTKLQMNPQPSRVGTVGIDKMAQEESSRNEETASDRDNWPQRRLHPAFSLQPGTLVTILVGIIKIEAQSRLSEQAGGQGLWAWTR
jgi:hypothetical protein